MRSSATTGVGGSSVASSGKGKRTHTMLSQQSIRVTNAFQRYAKSGDSGEIQEFTAEEIDRAIIEFANPVDRTSPFYVAMVARRVELGDLKMAAEASRHRWVAYVVTFVGGALLALLGVWLNAVLGK